MNVPAGQHPPFATITPDDHAAWIIISAALGSSMILLFAAIRAFIRAYISAEHGIDDYLVSAATVLGVVYATTVLKACELGLGKTSAYLEHAQLASISKYRYAGSLLYILALSASKAAICYFQLRLSPVPRFRRAVIGLLGLLMMWTIAFFVAIASGCHVAEPWSADELSCRSLWLRWDALETLGCLFEAALVAMACWLVWDLKTDRGNKAIVVSAFATRLILIIFVALRLASLDLDAANEDPTLRGARYVSWTAAEVNYSIISATIPIIRPFMSNLATNYGGGQGSSNGGYGSGYGGQSTVGKTGVTSVHASGSQSFPMRTLSRSKIRASTLQPDHIGEYSVDCLPSDAARSRHHVLNPVDSEALKMSSGDNASVDSDDSQRMIIRKDVSWQVSHADDRDDL